MKTYRGGRASLGACFRGLPRFPLQLLVTEEGGAGGGEAVGGLPGAPLADGGGEVEKISSLTKPVSVGEVTVALEGPERPENKPSLWQKEFFSTSFF